MNIRSKLLNIKNVLDNMLMESENASNGFAGLHEFANSIKPDQTTWARIREIILDKLMVALKRLKETVGLAHMESEGETWGSKLQKIGKNLVTVLSKANPLGRLDWALNHKLLVAGVLGFIVYISAAAYFYAGPNGESIVKVITSSIKSGYNEVVNHVKEFIASLKSIETPRDIVPLVIDLIKAIVRLPGKFIKGAFGNLEEKKFFSFMGEYEVGITVFFGLIVFVANLVVSSNGETNA